VTRRKRPPHLKKRVDDKPFDPADLQLFREFLADVTPIAGRNKANLPRGRPKPVRLHRDRDETLKDDLSDRLYETREPGEPLSFSRPGVQRQALRQLRRAGSTVEDELDLHGFTVAAARPMLVSFLNASAHRGLRRVRVIHGKGRASESGEGVLKGMVAGWLSQREDVLAFCQASPAEGGAGAVIVLLKSR
jgi:DNA-nicking Smr family endonuclease